MREPNAESFLKDVSGHKMTVLLDQKVYRHARFRKPGNSNMWFELVTWPNHLTIAGDMGTWTFTRILDMFEFFRDDELRINSGYWAEKLCNGTSGGRSNAKEFDQDAFEERVLDHLGYYDLGKLRLEEVKQAVRDEVFSDDKYDQIVAVRDFVHRFDDGSKFRFELCEFPDGLVYSYHFQWCLYAIVWGIQQWDALQSANAASPQPTNNPEESANT